MDIKKLKKYGSIALAGMCVMLCIGGIASLSKRKCEHTNKTLIAEIEATCTTDGKGAYVVCADCNKRLYDSDEVIPATGHKEKIVYEIEPTCTTAGRTRGSMCEECGLIMGEISEYVAPLGHAWERHAQKIEVEWGDGWEEVYIWAGGDICEYCGYDDSVNWTGLH